MFCKDCSLRSTSAEKTLFNFAKAKDGDCFVDIARILFREKGAEIDLLRKDKAGFTVLMLASVRRNYKLMKLFIRQGVDNGSVNLVVAEDPLILSRVITARGADTKVVKILVANGAKIDVTDLEDLMTPLAKAVKLGNVTMVDYLLEVGADPNFSIDQESRPLIVALTAVMMERKRGARKNAVDIISLLLGRGAKADIVNEDGWGPFMMMACPLVDVDLSLDVMRLLIGKDADINKCDQYGDTAILLAASQNGKKNLERIKFLVDNGADLNWRDNYGDGVLERASFAVEMGSDGELVGKENLDYFIDDKKMNVDTRDRAGNTVLMNVLNRDFLSDSVINSVKALCEKKADVNGANFEKRTVLMNAIFADSTVFEYLLNKGADADAVNDGGVTVRYLLELEEEDRMLSWDQARMVTLLNTKSGNEEEPVAESSESDIGEDPNEF